MRNRRKFRADEAGDTLVEVLLALAIMGLTAVSILGAFATTISATAEGRSFAAADTVLRSFVETANYQLRIQANPLFVPCPTSSTVYNQIATNYHAANGFSVSISEAPIPGQPCAGAQFPPPQLITASVSGPNCSGHPQCDANDHLSFIVTDPTNANGLASNPPVIDGISPNAGPASGPQTAVTISGTGLSGATSVTFGSNGGGTITNDTGTSITVTPPADTAAVEHVIVTVTTASGSSAPNAAAVYYYGPAVTDVSPSIGTPLGGTNVTITGSGLALATQVNFGSTPASSFTINSPNSISAVSPGQGAGPAVVDITVVTTFGTSATSTADQFSYGLSVLSVQPSSGPGAGGTAVTIQGSGFLNAFAVDFGSSVVPITPSTSDSSITVTSPAGTTGAVDVTVVTPTGSSSISPLDKFTYNPGPPVGLSIESPTGPSPGMHCGAPSSNDACSVGGVSTNNGSATFYVDFVDSSSDPVIFSTITPSTISVAGGLPTSITIPADESTSSMPVTVRLNGTTSKVCTLTFGAYTLTVTVTT